jgi:hypothetical protein
MAVMGTGRLLANLLLERCQHLVEGLLIMRRDTHAEQSGEGLDVLPGPCGYASAGIVRDNCDQFLGSFFVVVEVRARRKRQLEHTKLLSKHARWSACFRLKEVRILVVLLKGGHGPFRGQEAPLALGGISTPPPTRRPQARTVRADGTALVRDVARLAQEQATAKGKDA